LYRQDYPLMYEDLIRTTVESAKGSGFPDTLAGNSIVVLVLVLARMTWKQGIQFVITVQGDDLAMWAVGLRILGESKKMWKFTNFEFVYTLNEPAEFCGKALTGSSLVPDMVRTLRKVASKRVKDCAHWHQIRQSLLDRVALYRQIGIAKAMVVNAERNECSLRRIEAVFETLVAFSHLSFAQYEEIAPRREIGFTTAAEIGLVSEY